VVIKAFNLLIAKYWDGSAAIVKQNEVVDKILALAKGKSHPLKKDVLFKEHYLDIEYLFKGAGWQVTYDKPGFNETYEPSWTFTRLT
jgi:hypothetical protein